MRLVLILSLWLLWSLPGRAESVQILIQRSPLAGSQYYAVDRLQGRLSVGDALALVRESDNRFDARAIRVEWRGEKLGYLPRAANRIVSAAIDRGETLRARISHLDPAGTPWQRLALEVYLVL